MSVKTQIERIKQSKEDIITALESKGIDVPDNITIDELAALVAEIQVIDPEFYYNKPEVDSMINELSNEIVDLDKKIENVYPTFVSSIEECVDTDKSYVLPDGYIYTYTTKTETKNPKNYIPLAIVGNGDNSIYNGTGWRTGHCLDAGTGADRTDYSYYESTGFIPVKSTDTFRIKNFRWTSPYNVYDNITFYDSNFAILGAFTGNSSFNPMPQFLKDDGTVEACIENATTTNFSASKKSSIAYMRLSFNTIDSTTILTINEPLDPTITTSTGWFSTGVKFIADDNTERVDDLENRVSILEQSDVEGVVSYVVEEAKRVAKNVYSHQNANTFTYLAISDMHYLENYTNIVPSLIHAGQGMDLVRKYVNVDFATCLGDNGWSSGVEGSQYRATIEMGIEEIRSANACIDSAFRGIPNFRSVGNHDSLVFNYEFNNNDYLDANELFPLYGAYNRGAIFQEGNRERGYCYRDFDDWKVRIICMNTSDLSELVLPKDMQKPVYVSGTQGKWFAETIDLSNKADAEEWSVLILSHAPLDWGYRCIYLCDILKAYVEGGSVSVERDGVTISYNYAGKNQATIIGNCHGHNHNFQVDYLRRLVSGNTTEPITIKRFGIPNACFERSNERGENGLESGTDGVYDIEYGEATSYEKVANTAQDTSFCVVTIDTIARKIYADCYGAGYDRVISYGEEEEEEEVVTYTNIIDSVGTIDNTRIRGVGLLETASSNNAFTSNNKFTAIKGDVIRVYIPNGNMDVMTQPIWCEYSSVTEAEASKIGVYYKSGANVNTLTTTGYKFTVKNDGCTHLRVSGAPAGGYTNWIVTKNEPIPQAPELD